MPWMEATHVSQRRDFVGLALVPGANMRELCRRFGISPATGYKWRARFCVGGAAALADLSRRPHHSPFQTTGPVAAALVALRQAHPAWGGRKLRARVQALGHTPVPATSTVTDILRRHGLIDPAEALKHAPGVRFERATPNELWQMDYKGDFPLGCGRCHPWTILDDHSRFNIALVACANQRGQTIRPLLIEVFRRYGLPCQLLCDNGPPWGTSHRGGLTEFGAWLIRLGIDLRHGRPFHPQTQGKEERFHRSLKLEVLAGRAFADLAAAQAAFDPWRQVYNHQRPHEALAMNTPASRYQASPRPYPELLPTIEYAPDDLVRQADHQGYIRFQGRRWHIADGVARQPVGLRPTTQDGLWQVYFCHQKLDRIDLREYPTEANKC